MYECMNEHFLVLICPALKLQHFSNKIQRKNVDHLVCFSSHLVMQYDLIQSSLHMPMMFVGCWSHTIVLDLVNNADYQRVDYSSDEDGAMHHHRKEMIKGIDLRLLIDVFVHFTAYQCFFSTILSLLMSFVLVLNVCQ
jgi:hypothetical protein